MPKAKMKEEATIEIGGKSKILREGETYNLTDELLAQLDRAKYTLSRRKGKTKAEC